MKRKKWWKKRCRWRPSIPTFVIKLPLCAEGLKATKRLTARGIHTNVTLVFSTAQALLAARAGATYVSPFLERVDDISWEGMALVRGIVEIFKIHGIPTEIIAASIRSPLHVTEAAKAGAHIATVPYKVILQMIEHPLTKIGIELFSRTGRTYPKPKNEAGRRILPLCLLEAVLSSNSPQAHACGLFLHAFLRYCWFLSWKSAFSTYPPIARIYM